MPEQQISLYFDENMPEAAAIELANQGIDVMTTQAAKRCGASDPDQLRFAASLGRVLCSQDKDFLVLARTNPLHSGIAFIRFKTRGIGATVNALQRLVQDESPQTMKNSLRFL